MPIEVRLPELAESMSSATLTTWLKEVGDDVTEGEPIAEVETDKTTVELEAPATGVLEAIQVAAGTSDVAVGAVLALLRERSPREVTAAAEGSAGRAAPAVAEPPAAGPPPQPVTGERVEPAPPLPAGSAAAPPGGRPAAETLPAEPPAASGGTNTGAPAPVAAPAPVPVPAAVTAPLPVPEAAASPLARRMAELAGLDLASLRGTGEGGRVGKADVQRALRAGSAAPVAPPPSPAAPGADRPGGESPAPAPATGPHRDEPLTAARRVTAARMAQSKQTAPHFYLEVDCEADRILDRLRAAQAAASAAGSAPPPAGGARAPDGSGGGPGAPAADLTLTDLLVRAAALALARVPLANSAWIGDAVRVFETADVAVAVAAPSGLVTPVVRNAGAKALGALAAELRDLTARAREGRLQPAEYAGGTFTISNLGMYGVSRLFAILNPPQSCILGVGAVESRPVVRDGEVRAGRTMALTLSADHRALDGATGATFLRELRAIIEHPDPIFE